MRSKQSLVISFILFLIAAGGGIWYYVQILAERSIVHIGDTTGMVIEKLGGEAANTFDQNSGDKMYVFFSEAGIYFVDKNGPAITEPDTAVDYAGDEVFMQRDEIAQRGLPGIDGEAWYYSVIDEDGNEQLLLIYIDRKDQTVSKVFEGKK